MLIKIEDIPEGAKLKFVKIDLEFSVNGTETVSSNIETNYTKTEANEDIGSARSSWSPEIQKSETRKVKDIPQEMQDMEF
jgi:hypothetical protein